mgnify:CR=1 FL=1
MDEVIKRLRRLLSVPKCSDEDYIVSPVPSELKDEIFKDQKGLCWICGVDSPSIVPHLIRPDGPAVRENLVGTCTFCHAYIYWLLHKHQGYRKWPRFMGG